MVLVFLLLFLVNLVFLVKIWYPDSNSADILQKRQSSTSFTVCTNVDAFIRNHSLIQWDVNCLKDFKIKISYRKDYQIKQDGTELNVFQFDLCLVYFLYIASLTWLQQSQMRVGVAGESWHCHVSQCHVSQCHVSQCHVSIFYKKITPSRWGRPRKLRTETRMGCQFPCLFK